jgi:hypothetical protein
VIGAMRGKPFRRPATLALAALAIAAVAATAAAGDVVRAGNLIVTIDGGISPTKLPKREPAPITLRVSGSIRTGDGSHVPALKTLHLRFDRHGHIYTKGLATCTVRKLQSTLTAQAKRVCRRALVGIGRAEAEIAFPDQAPFDAGGTLLIFNGHPKGRKPVLIMHVYAFVPAPTTFVTTAVIGRSSGRYGTETRVTIPTIVAGQGSLISFKAKIRKNWRYKGKKRSLLLASCPNRRLYAHGVFTFADNTRLSGNVIRPCKPRG